VARWRPAPPPRSNNAGSASSVDGSKPIENLYRAAVQRIRYKWSKPAEDSMSQYIK
jgi:hypothetical protein